MAISLGDLEKVIDSVGRDKGIDKKYLVEAIEEALLTVARRKYGAFRDIEARYSEESNEVELFEFRDVVETVQDKDREISFEEAKVFDPDVSQGDSIGIKLDTSHLSRIAAQTAKQVIVQKVRDVEREIIFNEFKHRKGDVITGIVRRVDRGAVIVDLGKTEGYMPQKEQIPDELFNSGDRIQAYLKDVQLTPKGPRIILSRACPEYLAILFENEVPEIREGLVEIKGAARDPGVRAKVAVYSKDPDIDPIGSCVGVRGSRVQNIVQELKGERIDIVPWDEDISRYVINSLAPAEIVKVIIDDESQAIEVVVADEALSIAIGRRGQNVRLASHLTKWKLDIVSESEMNRLLAVAKFRLTQIEGISETLALSLYQNGFETAADLLTAPASVLSEVPGIGDVEKAESVLKAAQLSVDDGSAESELPPHLQPKERGAPAAKNEASSEETASENKGSDGQGASQSIEEKLKAELKEHAENKKSEG